MVTQVQLPEIHVKTLSRVAHICSPSTEEVMTGGALGLTGEPAYPALRALEDS